MAGRFLYPRLCAPVHSAPQSTVRESQTRSRQRPTDPRNDSDANRVLELPSPDHQLSNGRSSDWRRVEVLSVLIIRLIKIVGTGRRKQNQSWGCKLCVGPGERVNWIGLVSRLRPWIKNEFNWFNKNEFNSFQFNTLIVYFDWNTLTVILW